MRIAILGTRGIPNHYGGFEQYAELLSTFLANQNWDVTVYNTQDHPYKLAEYNGVKIIHKFNPEKQLGSFSQFIYDLLCILNTRKQKFDVIYQLGYTSSAIFNFLLPPKNLLVTNMDGLEWKRTKYNKYVQKFLLFSEKIVVRKSDYLIADSLGIKDYILNKYNRSSFYSAYTAKIPSEYININSDKFNFNPKQYNLLIARFEPENNIETIIHAHTLNNYDFPLVIIGNVNTKYGQYIKNKFSEFKSIYFIGGIYNIDELNTIRHLSNLYFHGHSVGGTNPSLLEAMACGCSVVAHDNIFNRSVLGNDAKYFSTSVGLNEIIINQNQLIDFFVQSRANNLQKIDTVFSEKYIFNSLQEKLVEWHSKK
jgi:glycosyltransferase involved in cell wall biosynthesis